MIVEILILILTIIVCYYFYSYKRLHWYFKERDVKFLPGVPIFGNMIGSTFLKRHFLEELYDIYTAFPDEKYVGFQELTMPILIIRDPELIKQIVIKDFDHFTDHREFFNVEADPLFGGSLFLMKGQRWRDMRTTLSPAFTATKMKFMLPFIVDISKNFIAHIRDHHDEEIVVDDLIRRFTNDVIASAAFGIEINSLKDKDNEFYKIGDSIGFNFNLKQRILLILNTQFPTLAKKLGIRLFPEKISKFFGNIITTAIEYRKTQKVQRPDMIQLLMETKREWTPDELIAQLFVFFTAGFDTSASVITMTIHELALNQKIQDKLYQECQKFKEEKEFNFENLAELKYLECVINEALRKWTPAIFMDRTCTKTYELPPPREGGKPYLLKPGDVIYNMVNMLHLDPKYWPEPEKFEPERFSEENKHNITPLTFSPFGGGPRTCIGIRFAMMEIKVLLYHLILNFKIVKSENTLDPIKLMPTAFQISAAGGTKVRFQKRKTD